MDYGMHQLDNGTCAWGPEDYVRHLTTICMDNISDCQLLKIVEIFIN